MGLVSCPDCGKQISSLAKTCPDCGRPKGSGWTQAERDEAIEKRIAARNEDYGNVGIAVDWGRNIIVIGFLCFIIWGANEAGFPWVAISIVLLTVLLLVIRFKNGFREPADLLALIAVLLALLLSR